MGNFDGSAMFVAPFQDLHVGIFYFSRCSPWWLERVCLLLYKKNQHLSSCGFCIAKLSTKAILSMRTVWIDTNTVAAIADA